MAPALQLSGNSVQNRNWNCNGNGNGQWQMANGKWPMEVAGQTWAPKAHGAESSANTCDLSAFSG